VIEQHAAVVAHARRHRPSAPRTVGDALRHCQRLAMLLEALDAEQLGPDDLFGMRETGRRWFGCAEK
jgi:hypothetical protein